VPQPPPNFFCPFPIRIPTLFELQDFSSLPSRLRFSLPPPRPVFSRLLFPIPCPPSACFHPGNISFHPKISSFPSPPPGIGHRELPTLFSSPHPPFVLVCFLVLWLSMVHFWRLTEPLQGSHVVPSPWPCLFVPSPPPPPLQEGI